MKWKVCNDLSKRENKMTFTLKEKIFIIQNKIKLANKQNMTKVGGTLITN